MTEREKWLEARRTGIGGSDAAAVLGISPWCSRYELWAQKRGLLPLDKGEEEYQEAGRRAEPMIAQWYEDETKRQVYPRPGSETQIEVARNSIRRHSKRPYLLANLDYYVLGDTHKEDGILELKNISTYRGDQWLERAPLHYQTQLQHYFAVTGLQWGSFAVVIGGNTFRWYDVQRDDRFIDNVLLPECEKFWRLVETGEPPPPDGSESTTRAIRRVHATTNGATVELPMPLAEELLCEYVAARKALSDSERRYAGVENLVRFAMEDAAVGVVPGRGAWTLKAAKGKTTRTLRWKDRK